MSAFEKLTGLQVTLHDLSGSLWPFLPPERMYHSHPLCRAVKVHHERACLDFSCTRLRKEISEQPYGRVQVCHAGLVEFVAPVSGREGVEWILFAGVRTPGPGLREAVRDTTPSPRPNPWPKGTRMPDPLDDEEAQWILESLRQLAARLKTWRQEMDASGMGVNSNPKSRLHGPQPTRRALIRRFILARHRDPVRLEDLAECLHLSESRAAHAVREELGATFLDLLIEARLRSATELLRHTRLTVLEVALRSGFGDVSHFHRCFRKRFDLTPLKFRKQAEPAFN